MPWKEKEIMSLKHQFISKVLANSQNISEICREFEISRVTAYKWISRYKQEGLDGLLDRPKRPYSSPQKTNYRQVDLILKTRDLYPAWGGRKLRQVLINEGNSNIPCEATINRILKAHEKIDPEESKKRTKMIRFEHDNPNDLWQMDFKGHFQMINGRCHPLTILDDHSRFALCLKGYASEGADIVRNALEEVFIEYGLPLRMTMDNGPQWKTASKLSIWLMRQGIKISHSRPYHPQTQGKEERFHRTLKNEVLKYRQFKDMEAAQNEFDIWRELYNCKRPHEGIGMLCPINRYVKSLRKYSTKLPNIEYLANDMVRKVRSCGQISHKGINYFVGEYLKGENVALRQIEEGSLEIIYVNTRLGRINFQTPL
jgi:transposase InsO family protein